MTDRSGFRPGRAVEHLTCPRRGLEHVLTDRALAGRPEFRLCSRCGAWVETGPKDLTIGSGENA